MPVTAAETYRERIRVFSKRIVEAQKPIRILNAIKWDATIDAAVKKSDYKELPKIGRDYYAAIPCGFEFETKLTELRAIIDDIRRELGEADSLGQLLVRTCEQYQDAVEMLRHRGTKRFWEFSRKLYGSPRDRFFEDRNTILSMSVLLSEILGQLDDTVLGPPEVEDIAAPEAVAILNKKFHGYFADQGVYARLDDGMVADAAAGASTVKIRESASFSRRHIDLLEVHEGWVHVGTTLNGQAQEVAGWLAKGPPRCTCTQEGLAVLMEILTFLSYPRRARIINDRILGIARAEDGANFLEVIEFYRTNGYDEDESLSMARRVFRGGRVEGGAPFTKDISYCKGFVENYNFLRAAVRAGQPQVLPFFFVGKLHVDDIPLLYTKYKEGIVQAPRHLPPQFRDIKGLAVWMSFSSYFNKVNLTRIQEHYDGLFRTHV